MYFRDCLVQTITSSIMLCGRSPPLPDPAFTLSRSIHTSLALLEQRAMQTASTQSASIDTSRLDARDKSKIAAASLSLKPVITPSGFVFPPIYSFPAFFTYVGQSYR
jgi:hypothetical protein